MVIVRLSCAARSGRVYISLQDANFDGLPWEHADIPLRSPRVALAQFVEDPPSSDVVQTMGQNLFRQLANHPTVKAAVSSALTSPEPCPIYLRMDSAAAAEYPWESLFDSDRGEFLALQPQWPIGRMMPGGRNPKMVYATTPLRMVAVLSAVGVDAAGEWNSLRTAIEESEIDLRLQLVIGQRELYDAIEADRPEWASCQLLSGDDTVKRALNGFDPHLVHFFCHGTARPQPLLELATPLGHDAGASDIRLDGTALKDAAPLAWLATLNCCSGASDAEGVRGLASELVMHSHYPAAIGMREPIADRDAHLFCERFYSEVFAWLAAAFKAGTPFDAEWANPLCQARRALCNAYANGLGPKPAAARHRKWTVPILCVEPSPLTIAPVAVHPSHADSVAVAHVLKQMNTLEQAMASVRASAAGRAAIRAEIDGLQAGLEAVL
jgi:hypothetical protein